LFFASLIDFHQALSNEFTCFSYRLAYFVIRKIEIRKSSDINFNPFPLAAF
jgi:hypothetical protein